MNGIVLIVEENDELRMGMACLLRDHGYCVDEASQGDEALRMLRVVNRPRPCVVLSDGNMPGLSGRELVSVIRKDPELASLPVAVISGGKAEVPGATRVIRKPIEPAALVCLVKELCRVA